MGAYNECLAVARLRQWARDRQASKAGRVRVYRNQGWAERRSSQFDAALTRIIDFERTMNSLTDEQKLSLILTYRDGHTESEVALLLGCSVRKIGYLLPAARTALAAALDKKDLL